MIVLGADTHKRSHTIAAVSAATANWWASGRSRSAPRASMRLWSGRARSGGGESPGSRSTTSPSCCTGCGARAARQKTAASALATLQSVLRFARRCGWIVADPVELLEHDERPRPQRRRQRVLGRSEIERLLAACSPRDRLMIATVLYTGLRISELLGLIWDDVDFQAGVIHVRAQLSRAHRGAPARRIAPKTAASVRDVPLVAQLARLLNAHRQRSAFARGDDWVFATARGTPYGHRNVSRRCLGRAAQLAGLNDDGWPPLRFHDLRHTFTSHLIIDLRLDPAQVSRILGHARITITLDTYTHLFEDARHARDIRTRMAASPFASLLERTQDPSVTVLSLR